MGYFKDMGFTFNGRRSSDYGLCIVSIGGNSTQTSPFGVERTVEEEQTNSYIPNYKGVKYTTPTLDISLTKVRNGNPTPFNSQELFDINQWLMGSNEYLPFVSDDNKDVIYYVMFTKGSKYENGLREGYLNLTMKLNCGSAFSTISHHQYRVQESKVVEIYNKSNVDKYIYPDIEFQLLGDSQNITITNLTLGEEMSFTNLPKESHIMCYNDGLKSLVCMNDKEYNVRPQFNKKWLRLMYGKNLIRIDSECKIDISLQNRIALQ